jgi:bacteriophage exclusion system BrxC/D-like protein
MTADLASRRAIEALRAGVPNRAAVRLLATSERDIEGSFLRSLQADDRRLHQGGRPLVIAGGFGAGKSHLLGYLQELALSEGFIVSHVVVSKETPLFDPSKMLAAAMRNAIVPETNDDVMTAVLEKVRRNTADELEKFVSQVDSGFSPIFAAILFLLPRSGTSLERIRGFGRFLGGGKLNMTDLRAGVAEAGARRMFDLKPVKELELALQRIRFAPLLFRAAGFKGWCVLLDEVELIGRYGAIQRGRSYAELARWLGLSEDVRVDGVIAVGAITDDFTDVVINARQDDELLPERLRNKGLDQGAKLARLGMEHLKRHQRLLRPPSAHELELNLARVRDLYVSAYGAGELPLLSVGETLANRSMRQHIKSWITQWDMHRLYRRQMQTEEDTIASDYSEAPEMERSTKDSGDDAAD